MTMESKMMQAVKDYNSRKFEFNIKDAFYQFEDYFLDYINQEGDKKVLLENKGNDDIFSTADHVPFKAPYKNSWGEEFNYVCVAEMGVSEFVEYDGGMGILYSHQEWHSTDMEWKVIYESEILNLEIDLYVQLKYWSTTEKNMFARYHHARLFRFWQSCAMYYLDCLENSTNYKIHECPHFIDDSNFDQKKTFEKFSEYLNLMIKD